MVQMQRRSVQIYAKDKKLGAVIENHDHINLFYLGEGRMVNLSTVFGLGICDGTINPPRHPLTTSYT